MSGAWCAASSSGQRVKRTTRALRSGAAANPIWSKRSLTAWREDRGFAAAESANAPRASSRPHWTPASRAASAGAGLVRETTEASAMARPAYSGRGSSWLRSVASYSQPGRPRPDTGAADRRTRPAPRSPSRCSRTVLACVPVIDTSAARLVGSACACRTSRRCARGRDRRLPGACRAGRGPRSLDRLFFTESIVPKWVRSANSGRK